MTVIYRWKSFLIWLLLFGPSGLGDQNSANGCPCACRKRRLTKGYKLSYTTGLLHAVRRMSSDSLPFPKYGHMEIPKILGNEPCVGAYYSFNHGTHTSHFRVKIRTHTRRISEFFEMVKTAGAYSLQIPDHLNQIQRKTKTFRLIVRHNTEGPPITDWQWRHHLFLRRISEPSQPSIIL